VRLACLPDESGVPVGSSTRHGGSIKKHPPRTVFEDDLPGSLSSHRISPVKLLLHHLPPGLQSQREPLAQCLQAMAGVARVRAVYLFGSHARGKAQPGNDVDLCTVAEVAERQLEMAARFREAIWDVRPRLAFTLIPITPAPLAEEESRRDHFFGMVLKVGVRLTTQVSIECC
jgi:hypothetical protein